MRVELTKALDRGQTGLRDALVLLEISDKTSRMSTEELQIKVSKNPYDWPWFTAVLAAGGNNNTFPSSALSNNSDFIPRASLMPVTILVSRQFLQLSNNIENLLISKAKGIYEISNTSVTANSQSTANATNNELRLLLEKLPQGSGIQLSLILVRALLSSASLFVNGMTCRSSDYSPSFPPFVLNACGLNVTYFIGGCPQMLWSRVLSLRKSYAKAAISCSNESTRFRKIKDYIERTSSSQVRTVSAMFDSAIGLPGHMLLSHRLRNDHFYPHVFGTTVRSTDTEPVTSPKALREIHSLL